MSDATDQDEATERAKHDGHDEAEEERAPKPPSEAELIREFSRGGSKEPQAPMPHIPAPKGIPPRLPVDSPLWEPWRTF
jgi:hypothetical protein